MLWESKPLLWWNALLYCSLQLAKYFIGDYTLKCSIGDQAWKLFLFLTGQTVQELLAGVLWESRERKGKPGHKRQDVEEEEEHMVVSPLLET